MSSAEDVLKRYGRSLWLLTFALMWLGLGCQKESGDAAPTTASAEAPPQAAAEEPATDAVELEFWKTVKDSEHAEDLLAYIKSYPDGAFVELAEARLERLMKQPAAPPPPPPPVAATPRPAVSPPPPPPRRSRRDLILNLVRRELGGYIEPRLHISPDIPRKKRDNAAVLHGIPSDSILVLYDDGLGGGGKSGFCLTEDKVYWRFVAGSPAMSTSYENIESLRVRNQKFQLNGNDIGTTMAQNPDRAAEVFADMLDAIRDELRRR